MSLPTISVLIPCHNAAAFVAEAVECALGQTLSPHQIIVVDDGSTDGSADRLARFGDRIVLIRQSNQGRAAAVHAAAARATGDVLAFLDADDSWHPRKLESSVDALRRAEHGMVHTRITLRRTSGDSHCPWNSGRIRDWALISLLEGNSVCCSSVVMWRRVWNQLGGFQGRYWPCDDYHLWLRCAARYRIGFVDEPLVSYRIHEHQASAKRSHMVRQMARVVCDFLNDYPDVAAALSPALRRWVCQDRFVETAIHYAQSGRQELARDLLHWCVKQNPLSMRAWCGAFAAQLPWQLYKFWLDRNRTAAQVLQG